MYFGVTVERLVRRLSPKGNQNSFVIGNASGQVPEATVLEKIQAKDEYVASRAPARYRTVIAGNMVGEILVEFAAASQPTATLGLKPVVAGTLVLYKNYCKSRPYENRKRECDAMTSGYDLAEDTGVVTFDPVLSKGDRVYADYRHTGMADCLMLGDIVIGLAAAEMLDDMPSADPRLIDRIEKLERQAYGDLDRLRRSESGIIMIDKIKRVDEQATLNDGGQADLGMVGGYV